jgi:hypothetical protein
MTKNLDNFPFQEIGSDINFMSQKEDMTGKEENQL